MQSVGLTSGAIQITPNGEPIVDACEPSDDRRLSGDRRGRTLRSARSRPDSARIVCPVPSGLNRHAHAYVARLPHMERRIYGLENEYGVTCTLRGQRRLSPDEVARYLFRRVVSWGRSSNVFLQNGARLYLDVGSHPEYATPECDSLYELVVHDKAGERILEQLVESAEQRLAEESIRRHDLPVQEQHRLCRQLLRVPRELSDRPAMTTSGIPGGAHPVLCLTPDLHRRRQGAADRPRRRDLFDRSTRRAHLGRCVVATTRSRPIIDATTNPTPMPRSTDAST